MASSVKVGMAALVVLAVVAGFAGPAGAGVTCSPSCFVRIDDLTETPTVGLFLNPTEQNVTAITNPQVNGELITFTLSGLSGASSGLIYADLFEDSVGGTLSDRVLVIIAPSTSGFTNASVTFASDPAAIVLPPGATQVDALIEDGTFQNLPHIVAALGPTITSFEVRSDAGEAVPEPSTLLLLGGPLAGLLGMTWRRRRQRESRA